MRHPLPREYVWLGPSRTQSRWASRSVPEWRRWRTGDAGGGSPAHRVGAHGRGWFVSRENTGTTACPAWSGTRWQSALPTLCMRRGICSPRLHLGPCRLACRRFGRRGGQSTCDAVQHGLLPRYPPTLRRLSPRLARLGLARMSLKCQSSSVSVYSGSPSWCPGSFSHQG